MKKCCLLVLCLLAVRLLLPPPTAAGELDGERQVQHDLLQSKALLLKVAARQQAGQTVSSEIGRLKTLALGLAGNHQLLRERFAARDGVVAGLGATAAARHGAMRQAYLDFLDEYLATIATLPDDSVPAYILDSLKSRLETMLPGHPAPLLGALPYRHLRLPGRLPATTPAVVPAYLGGARTVTAADLADSPEAPITEEIAALAQSLNWSPVEIYGWVKNNIRSEWYWGSMKGATEILRQRSGNDADQAALLVALLRASGYPARFVRGTIEFFPDPAGVMAQTGVSDIPSLLTLFQQAGIPCQPIIRGGRIVNLQVEHIWVETEVPYDNYRGVVMDGHGKTWLALDTQIKSAGVTVNSPPALPTSVNLAGLRDQYLAGARPESPLEFVGAAYTAAGAYYPDLMHYRSPLPEAVGILPASLQFNRVAVTGEYTTLPDPLKHRVRLVASHDNSTVFDGTLPLADLSNHSLAITYEPSTVEDQEIINSYGGLGNTPAYLVHLRPVLTVDGARTLIGTSGLPVGSDFKLTVELIAPNHTERLVNSLTIGNLAVLGLVAQQAVLPDELDAADKNGERLLHERALAYIDQWNQAEDELAALLDLPLVRPLPTLVTVGGVAEVSWLLNVPHGFEWRGVYVDADFRAVELIGPADRQKIFMQLSGLQGSVLEELVLSEGFGVAAVSTAKLLGLSNGEGLTPLELNQANLDLELPGLDLPPNVADDIKLAVAQGLRVTIPPGLDLYEDWQGVGYRKEDPASGEAGWMLAGSIAGGMTAWTPERWPQNAAAEVLANPGNVQSNRDPNAAMFIQKITATDLQVGTVGQPLPKNLQVYVTDRNHKPVKGADVVFSVKAGGGRISGQQTLTVKTDYNGVASVSLTFGQHTNVNPVPWLENGTTYSQQVDANIVDAALKSGTTIASPFTVLAKPGPPYQLEPTSGWTPDLIGWGYVLNWAGPVGLIVTDQYNNSIANQPVTFTAVAPVNQASCANPVTDPAPALLVSDAAPCALNFPTYGGSCGGVSLDTITDNEGAHAQVILGPMPEAKYRIIASAGKLGMDFDWLSWPRVDCQGSDKPGSELLLGLQYHTDQFGRVINAGPVGGLVPVAARCTLLRENGAGKGDGTYYLDNSAVSGVVLGVPPVAMVTQGNGVYAGEYPLAQTAGENKITVTCSAMVDGGLTTFTELFTAVGVALDFPYVAGRDCLPPVALVAVNEEGYLTRDQPIGYRIQPASYQAGSAYLFIYKDDQPIFIVPTETRDVGFATLGRGMWFAPGGNYQVEVVLNPGSRVEIRSVKIPLRVVALELKADLNGDGQYTEDDPREHTSPGLLVALNRDDDDGDGIIDSSDDTMLKTNPDGATTEVEDDELVEIHLAGLPTGLDEGAAVLELIQGQDQLRVWSDRKKGLSNLLLDVGGLNGASSRKVWPLGGDPAGLAQLPKVLYLEGVTASPAGTPALLVTRYISPEGAEIEADRLLITVYSGGLVPDYDRNGVIDEQDQGKVTSAQPWRFWVNDDNDGSADASGIGSSENDLPGQNKDNASGQVNGIRDLIDFFPLRLDPGQILTLVPPEQGYSYWLSQADAAVAMLDGSQGGLLAGNSGSYLTDLDIANIFAHAPTALVTAGGMQLSDAFIQAIRADNQAGIILLEGLAPTTAPLVLEVRDVNGQLVLRSPLPLEIVKVEEMYGHKNLRAVAGGSAEDPSRTPVSPPYNMTEGSNKVLLWMHGYNVNPQQARGTFAEVFKRFYHAGLMGKFYGVSWYGDPPAPGAPHYHQAAVNAFATAGDFAAFVGGLSGEVSIAAHSLGNLVVGSAIQDKGMTNFSKYFAVDASVALEAYGQTTVDEGMLKVDNWLDYWKYQGTDGQGNPVSGDKLLASEWYKRFEGTDDNRKALTWRNRLGMVVSTQNGPKVYNFFSSTEDVLRAYPGDNLIWDGAGSDLAMYSWVKQEKFKGRSVIPNIGGASSPFAGWSFNRGWYIDKEPPEYDSAFNRVKIRQTPEQAVLIDKEELKTKPFFDPPMAKIIGTDLAELVSSTGSAFVDKNVNEDSGLDKYYTSNATAHDKVKVKDWLLAEAFPATSLPMGGNENTKLLANNIDMSGVKSPKGGCCKTSEDSWPRRSTQGAHDWKHSDYKDVSYQHTFEFYKTIDGLTKN